jgi:DNA polymerase-3 subunit chi
MTEIRFYHLERQPIETALPALLTKALSTGKNIVVKANSAADVEKLNDVLWTYDPNSFLPHGSAKDGHAEKQPIWLTDSDENPNNAKVLILINGVQSDIQTDFDLCCEIFDSTDQNALNAARQKWKSYKDTDFELTYWQQTDNGWQKKDL